MSGSIALSVLMASALASQPSAPQAAAESSQEFIISEAAQDTRGKPPFYGKNCNKISASIQQCAREFGSQ